MTISLHGGSPLQSKIAEVFYERNSSALADYAIEVTINEFRHATPEGFKVSAALSKNKITAIVGMTLEHSLRYALNAILRWIKDGAKSDLTLEDGPQFAIRGVIEGFYGKPWSHSQRLRALEHFGDFNMNTYFLAPKDDPLQRFNWRSPFSNEYLRQAEEISGNAVLQGLSFVACVSPGLSVQYSSPDDVAAVTHRFKQLLDIGITHFGLLWDDISWELSHSEDISRYTTTAAAQADFTNQIWHSLTALNNQVQLTLCPMQYSGRGNEAYLIDLGRELKSRINIMWTGRQIISEYLDVSDAVIFERSALRPALYWDNFPVNDGSLQSSLFIGPLRGREKGLYKYSAGLVSNPMVQFEPSILPLSTVGQYLWNSDNYNPDEAWERALIDLFEDSDERASLRAFFRCSMGSPVGGDPAPDLRKVFNAAVVSWRSGDMQNAAHLFIGAGNDIIDHHAKLVAPTFSHSELINEIRPWLNKFRIGGEVLIGLGNLLKNCSFDVEKRSIIGTTTTQEEIARLKEKLQSERKNLFGDQIEGPLNELSAELRTYE